MSCRLSVEERRAHLVEAAIGLAEKKGVGGVTTRDVARAAGVSLGVVHYCFENKDALMTELVKVLASELRDTVADDEAIWKGAGTGKTALRRLVCGGLELLWSGIEKTPHRQLLAFETTTYALRESARAPTKLAIARERYCFDDRMVAELLDRAAVTTSCRWTVPLPILSRMLLGILDGMVLRWLVDDDSASAHTQLAMISQLIAESAEATTGE